MPINEEDKAALDALFFKAPEDFESDDTSDIIKQPVMIIDLDEVNGEARRQAEIITERLSNYYFDEKYLNEHPYIPAKIAQEIDMIRRLLKMLSINEKAQDSLIVNITSNAGKGSLYSSLTSLQTAILNIQKQLSDSIENLETIFRDMQAECEKTFSEKPKEESLEDGSMIVRGSREFIESITKRMNNETTEVNGETVDTNTGEIINTQEAI